MFVKAIKIVRGAMFPIFRLEQIKETQIHVGIAGTGFFVGSNGYFVSVAHVFDNKTSKTKFQYLGLLPEEVQNPALEVKEIGRDDQHDIFVGKIEINNPMSLSLIEEAPDIGRSVCITGYPLATITLNPQGGLEVGGVRRYFQPTFVLDKARAETSGNGTTRLHDGFLLRDAGLFGMSGGPVFSVDGRVAGIQGSVTEPRTSKSAGGREIHVENALIIRSDLILDYLKTLNLGGT